MEENININDLVVVKQLPEIFSQLDVASEIITNMTKDIDLVECTEENKQEVKKNLQKLRTMKTSFENKRKQIKKEINKPYEEFEDYYNKKIKGLLDNSIDTLDIKVKDIEVAQINEKRDELQEFLDQYREFYHVEELISSIDQVPIKINLSNSLKSLKEEIIKFCKKLNDDMMCIASEEFREDILLEYQKNGFDYVQARLTIINRNKEKEALKKKLEQVEEVVKEEEKIEEKVEEIIKPVEVVEEEELEITFTVKATRTKLRELKEFMKEKEIEYK